MRKFLLGLMGVFLSFSLAEGVTIEQLVGTNPLQGGGPPRILGQSFQVASDGVISSISVAPNFTGVVTFTLYENVVDCRSPGAFALTTRGVFMSGTASASGDTTADMFTIDNIGSSVTSGMHTFCIKDNGTSLDLLFNFNGGYANGDLYDGGHNGNGDWQIGMDLAFKVELAVNNPPTGKPTISGTTTEGETLTADASAIADADGMGTGTKFYKWKADGVDIAGATSQTYTLTSNEVGKAITVEFKFVDGGSTLETILSDATANVAAAPPTAEDSAPAVDGGSTGDGNGDGTADSSQDYVQSKNTAIGWVTAASADGGGAGITVTQSASNGDVSGVSAPYGKFAVDITNIAGNAGDTATIDLFIPYNANIDRLYKLNRASGNYDLIASTVTHYPGDGRTKITYDVVDGGNYDQDGAADDNIQDPAIPAGPFQGGSSTAPIGKSAYLFLALAFLLIGMVSIYRKSLR